MTTPLAINDVINFFYLPAGATIRGALLRASVPLDSNGSPTLTIDVGYTGSTAAVFSQSLAGSSTTSVRTAMRPSLNWTCSSPPTP